MNMTLKKETIANIKDKVLWTVFGSIISLLTFLVSHIAYSAIKHIFN